MHNSDAISKSMKNQYRIHVRKDDAKMMEDGWKMEAKLEPISIKNMKKQGPRNDAKKEAHRQRVGG